MMSINLKGNNSEEFFFGRNFYFFQEFEKILFFQIYKNFIFLFPQIKWII